MTTRADNYERYRGEWRFTDSVETCTLLHRDVEDQPVTQGVKARRLLPKSRTQRSAGDISGTVESTHVKWILWDETLPDYPPSFADILTDEDGVNWTLGESISLERWGTQWHCDSQQTIEV